MTHPRPWTWTEIQDHGKTGPWKLLEKGDTNLQQCQYFGSVPCFLELWLIRICSQPFLSRSNHADLRCATWMKFLRKKTLNTASKPRAITVLVVDDEPVVLEVRRRLLKTLGYAALTARSSEEGLGLFRTGIVDIVVLDYSMPGMDGEETAREIRKVDRTIPIILSTACVDPPKAILELVTEYVPKGLSPEHLIYALQHQAHRVRSVHVNGVTQPKQNRAATLT